MPKHQPFPLFRIKNLLHHLPLVCRGDVSGAALELRNVSFPLSGHQSRKTPKTAGAPYHTTASHNWGCAR